MAALMLNAGAATVYAQPPVNITFSGDGGPSAINLNLPNTRNGEENLAGNGTFGPFTFRLVRATATSPQPSSTCSDVFFPTIAGAGLFRFQDGSLLKAKVIGGGDCVDMVQGVGHCTLTFQIEGGTGRFEGALGGILTLTETGGFTGWIAGVVGKDEGPQGVQR
jgi:hypothetical protein